MRIIGKIQDQEQELQIYVQDEAGNWEWSSMLSKEEWTQQIFRNILLMQSRTDLASGLAQHPIHLAIRAEPLKFRF